MRCIKPNAAQAPAVFEETLVVNQLRYLGVMETVRIRRAGYPVKCAFGQIVRDFSELHIPGWSRDAPRSKCPPSATPQLSRCTSSAPQRAPGGSGQLGTPRVRPGPRGGHLGHGGIGVDRGLMPWVLAVAASKGRSPVM